MKKTLQSLLLLTLTLTYTFASVAGGLFSYAGFNAHYSSVNLDEAGATSLEDDTYGFSLFAASRLYKSIHLEYGYIDLGSYSADYDITVASFRLVESHRVDFSKNIYTGLVLKASFAQILETFGLDPRFEKAFFHAGLGALFWNAKMEMTGDLYDSGTLLSPYSGSGDDTGLSHYFELGLGYQVSTKFTLNLIFSTYFDVGKGTELKLLDGSQQEYQGIDIDTVSLGLIYSF